MYVPTKTLLSELAELKDMSATQLRDKWCELTGRDHCPFRQGLIRKHLAYLIQENHYGGLNPTVKQELKSYVDKHIPTGRPQAQNPQGKFSIKDALPGQVFIREYKNLPHKVRAMQGGFMWQKRFYPSSTALARSMTGSPTCSGPKFFEKAYLI